MKIHLFNFYIVSNAIKFRKINREFRMEICDVGNEFLLVLFSLSSVNDKHNVRNSHTSFSNISGQDNLKEMQSRAVSDSATKNTVSTIFSLILYSFFSPHSFHCVFISFSQLLYHLVVSALLFHNQQYLSNSSRGHCKGSGLVLG